MSIYSLMLFVHIASVLCLFGANALQVVALLRLSRAQTTPQVQEWLAVMGVIDKVPPISAVLVVVSGGFMAFLAWGGSQPWFDLAFVLILLIGIMSALVHGPRVKAIRLALADAPSGPLTARLSASIGDSALWAYTFVPSLLTLGAVALMVLKLDWFGSILVTVAAGGGSLLLGLLLRRTPATPVTLSVQK